MLLRCLVPDQKQEMFTDINAHKIVEQGRLVTLVHLRVWDAVTLRAVPDGDRGWMLSAQS